MKKKSKRRADQRVNGKELGEAELEQAVGGVALQEASGGAITAPDTTSVDQAELLKVQMAMQKENQVFTSVSNVLKTRHDTAKNSITNVR